MNLINHEMTNFRAGFGPRWTGRIKYLEGSRVYKNFRIIFTSDKNKPVIINKKSKYPHVFAKMTTRVSYILKNANLINDLCGDNKAILFGGMDDRNYDIYAKSNDLLKIFEKVLVENLDIEHSDIKTWPSVGNFRYLKSFGVENFDKHLNSKIKIKKSELIGTSYGKVWPHVTKQCPDRARLDRWLKGNKLIKKYSCDPKEYLDKTASYSYFASPRGTGVQCAKIWEAIICETVPVMTDHVSTRQLKEIYGMPILIVDDWNQIDSKMLKREYKKQFCNINWRKIKNSFLADNFIKSYIE